MFCFIKLSDKIKRNFILLLTISLIQTTNTFAQNGWTILETGVNVHLFACHFISEDTGFAAGDNGYIVRTSDGGQNWNAIQFQNTSLFSSITYSNGKVWVAGSKVVYSEDLGLSWNTIDSFEGKHFYEIKFINNSGFLVGPGNHLFKTTNAGLTWDSISISHPTSQYYTISVVNDSVYYLGGYARLIKTTNGGESWELISNTRFLLLEFINEFEGWGMWETNIFSSIISHTTDGGITWQHKLVTPEGRNVYHFKFVSPDKGFAVGMYGQIWVKEEEEDSWLLQHKLPVFILFRLSMLNQQVGYISGSNGYILKTVSGGLSDITNTAEELNTYELFQNYPNPFNPSTTISYQLPVSGNVSLKVYDLLGREVATLVDEERPAGKYEVEFDASQLSSGVYLYKLTAAGYTSIKKLMLMK